MRREVNSYAVKSIAIGNNTAEVLGHVAARVAQVPNLAWLMLILLTVSALSYTTLTRSREQERDAQARVDYTRGRVNEAAAASSNIRLQTEHLKSDPQASKLAARERLHLVRKNEVIVAVK